MATYNSINAPTTASTVVSGNGTGFTALGYSSTGGTSNLVSRDSNGNTFSNNFTSSVTSTVSSGSPVNLSAGTTRLQIITGTSTQTFKLPNATQLNVGTTYEFDNNSTGLVSINDNSNTLVTTVVAGGYKRVVVTNISSPAGVWDSHSLISVNSSWGTLGATTAGYINANSLNAAYTTTATAAGTTTLTALSTQQQYFTGATTQTVVMPVTSTLVLGQSFLIVNNSSGIVTVQSSGANTIKAMGANTVLIVTVILTSGTSAASWNIEYSAQNATGTVTSVDVSVPSVLSISGNPITTSGTLAIGYSGTALPVANGGTGLTSTTANEILYSSATNTIAGLATANNGVLITSNSGVPSLLANGSTGQILTATASAPPSWTNTAGIGFSPNSSINLYDDFMSFANDNGVVPSIDGSLSWTSHLSSATTNYGYIPTATTDSAHPGILSSASFTSGSCNVWLTGNNSTGTSYACIVLGGGQIVLNWVFNIVTASSVTNRYTLRLGLGTTAATEFANGCYVEYSDNINSGNWNFKTANASTRTTSNSSIAVTTGWHNCQITINAAASSVSFVMDGVSMGSAITTNIPTAAIMPSVQSVWTAGTIPSGAQLIDLFYMTQTLTTAR
tara:strand:+ start:1035 stop:2888 length:1854 start_codon:yes stop_codon:yes gene_type:complete